MLVTAPPNTHTSILFPRLNSSSTRILPSNERCSSVSVIFVALHWTHSVKTVLLEHWRVQDWTQHFRFEVPSAKQ